MKSIFASALMAAVSANNVHKYFAESNFICGICQEAVTLANNGQMEELGQIYKLFPALEAAMDSYIGSIDELDLTKPK